MTNVQIENGYTKIANELLEIVMQQKLNGTQFKIIMAVWRFTYGFNRKEHEMSLGFLSKATGVHKQQLKNELDKLIELNVITVTGESSYTSSRKLSFNKNYDEWNNLQSVKKVTVSESTYTTVSELTDTTVSENTYPTVSESTYQEINIKENIKENIKTQKSKVDYTEQFNIWWEEYPKKKDKKTAFKSYQSAVKNHSPEFLLEGLKGYKEHIKKSGTIEQYIKYPATFLNGESFKDYQSKKQDQKQSGSKLDPTLLRKLKRIDELVDLMEQAKDDNTFKIYEQERNQLKEEVNMVG